MRVKSLEISNILSIERAAIDFDESGLVLVEGWNHDDGRANGAGKTALFNSLCFALFDKLPRKITASEILRRGADSGFVGTRLLCGQDDWQVIRKRPKGVEFYKNGVRVDISQKEFESNLRLTYDQFILSMYTAQNSSGGIDRFLLKSDTDKKTFLLRLLDLEKFAACKKLADDKIKILNADIATLNTKVSNNASKISAYQESLVDEDSIKESLDVFKTSIVQLTSECNQLANVPKPDLSKFIKLEDEIYSKQDEITKAKAKREVLHEQYRVLQQGFEQRGSDTCLECGSSLDTPERRKKHAEAHASAEHSLSNIRNELSKLDSIIEGAHNVADLHRRLRDRKQKEASNYQAARERFSELNSFINSKQSQVDSLSSKLTSNSDLKDKIAKLIRSNKELETIVESKSIELQVLETVASIYSPTGAQAYILDSVVDSFNDVVGNYIDIVWPNASYQINSYKENAKGNVVAKFSEELLMGQSEVSVGSLSGGEFKALSLCIDFAILEVLNKQFGIDLNPIILDEPFDGLDSAGKDIVIDLLSKLAETRQIIVVDHATEAKAFFPKIISVSKRNGISSVNLES